MRYLTIGLLMLVAAGCQSEKSMTMQVAPSAQAVEPIDVGEAAPTARMESVAGGVVEMAEVYRQQPTVLVFYRGGWCPYCNRHLSDLAKVEDELRGMGFQVVAVSPDRSSQLRRTLDKQELSYTLLSDADAALAKAFGLAFKVDDATLSKYDEYGISLEKASGQDHHILPVPAVYLIDAEGVVRYAHWDPDYQQRLSGDEVVEAARRMGR